MAEAAFASPVGIVNHPKEIARIRCGCGANGDLEKIKLNHGVYANGALAECPKPRAIEYLGSVDEMSALVERYGFHSWDEFAASHPYMAKAYLMKNAAKHKFQKLRK